MNVGRIGPLDPWTEKERREFLKDQLIAAGMLVEQKERKKHLVQCACGEWHWCGGLPKT